MTLSQTLSIISADLLRDPSYWVWSRANLTRLINKSYETLQADLKWFLSNTTKTATISLIVWTQEYSLPTDFLTVKSIIFNDRELTRTEKDKTTDDQWTPWEYYLFGWYIGFYPNPWETGTVTLYYENKLDSLSLDADTFDTPNCFDYAIMYLTASAAFKQVAKFEQAAVNEQEYYKELNKGKLLVVQDLNIDYHPRQQ